MESIKDFFIEACERKASDIHLSTKSFPLYRIDGELVKVRDYQLNVEDTERLAKELLTEEQWNELDEVGELDFSYSIPQVSRYRINVFKQRNSIAIVSRVIAFDIPTFDSLNLPDILKRIVSFENGIVLVTGPTGSGKSSTLAAMIDYVNTHMNKHIITLEDPIEFLHSNKRSLINQREVGADTKAFTAGLRASLRQDPDIILVGELRDLDTISTALTAAETGHLVLGTLHTVDSVSTIDRIIDSFPANQQDQIRVQLAEILKAVVSQKLLKKVCGGRVAAHEILINNHAIKNLIRNEKNHQIHNTILTSSSEGMCVMKSSIQKLLMNGDISPDEAMVDSEDDSDF